MRVLRATGAPFEADLPFSALHQLARPLLHRLGDLPAQQADALRTVFAIDGSSRPVNRLAAYVATLSLLVEGGRGDAGVGVVDDAQWLDRASADALGSPPGGCRRSPSPCWPRPARPARPRARPAPLRLPALARTPRPGWPGAADLADGARGVARGPAGNRWRCPSCRRAARTGQASAVGVGVRGHCLAGPTGC